ncbi:MAG: hypothetical protein R2705_17755 [Ilumatobacteraceae bacterium]
MFKLFRRSYKYLVAKLTGNFNEGRSEGPTRRAITEAREQDQRLP